jgi:hypothetical protein
MIARRLLSVIAASWFISQTISAQIPNGDYPGDTLYPWVVISFEEPSSFIQIGMSGQNIWQIGPPQKTIFNQAYTVPNAMVTDIMSPYPVDNHSYFDLCIGAFNNQMYPYDIFIDFRHKYDTDTLQDGGYITVSWDHGETWMNILEDTLSQQFFYVTPSRALGPWGNTNLYFSSNTLFNGEHGFSGRSGGWVHSCMAWFDLPVKHPADFPPDTMILRFNFISDNIHQNREGWMIDQLRVFSLDLGSGMHEIQKTPLIVRVAPNPINENPMAMLNKVFDEVEYQLIDQSGRILLHGNPGRCRQFEIKRADLSAGIYLLKVTAGNGQITSSTRIVLL